MKKLLLSLVMLSGLSLFIGVGELSVIQLLQNEKAAWDLFILSRVPRLLAILLAGAGLSIAGLVMQQISQNRFAAPSTSGTIECAMLGYVLSLSVFGHGNALWLIFLMAMLGTGVFVFFIQRIQFKNVVFVPLIGIVFGNVVDSAASFISYKLDVIQNVSSWGVANFANLLQGDVSLLYLAVPMVLVSYLYAARISAVGIGKDFAVNLGLNYLQVVVIGIILVSVMSATVVMIVGQLPFLGLIVPNLVSHYYGDNMKKNIPLTAVVGAIIVLACDVVSRLILFPYELPISIVISLLGGMVFIALILRGQRRAG